MATKKADTPLTFENPPPLRGSRYDWDAIAAGLRKKPNKWAKVFDNDRYSLATSIKINGINALLPRKGFVVSTRNNHHVEIDGKQVRICSLYLKYDPSKDMTSSQEKK